MDPEIELNFKILLNAMHSGNAVPDDDEEEDLSDMEEGDDADATSAKQLSKKQQVSWSELPQYCVAVCVQACLSHNLWRYYVHLVVGNFR